MVAVHHANTRMDDPSVDSYRLVPARDDHDLPILARDVRDPGNGQLSPCTMREPPERTSYTTHNYSAPISDQIDK